jgi:hypothetical protein
VLHAVCFIVVGSSSIIIRGDVLERHDECPSFL